MPHRTRLAIVTPWFGENLRGGAEQQSWQLAHELAARGHVVDVLTTTCTSFSDDWGRNGRRAGIERQGALTVRRFRLSRRDRRAFDRVNAILMTLGPRDLKRSVSPLGDEDARAFYDNNINSAALCSYLQAEGDKYSHLLFLPYLYGTTLHGLPLVAERAYLQPCLHDESYAYLTRVAEIAHAAKGLLLNSEGELELAQRIFGPGIIKKSRIVGEGVSRLEELPVRAGRVGSFVPSDETYVLYLGRQDPLKNVPTLVQAFGQFRRRQPTSRMKLVLAGERPVSYGDSSKAIVDLGPVSEAEKSALLDHCRALVQPSTNESFSRVIYEAWMHGRPVVVHRDCLPTQTAVSISGGGYLADTAAAWEQAITRIDRATDAELDGVGALGRAYANEVSSWPTVVERYERFLGIGVPPSQPLGRVWQLVPSPSESSNVDAAIRRYAESLGGALRRFGFEVTKAPADATPPPGEPAIVHVPAGAAKPLASGAVVLHGDGAAERSMLESFARSGASGFASTPAGLGALGAAGYPGPQLLPVCVDPRRFDALPDVPLVNALQDGKDNFAFVGRIADIEPMRELLEFFLNYLTIEREARLTIVGAGTVDRTTYARLFEEVQRLELIDRVLVARDLTTPQLQAIYRAADLFVSFDAPDDFGEAFLQAMWFDVPILAHKNPVSSWLVGPAGILINDKSDLLAVAALAHTMITDRALRARIVASQRRVRATHDLDRTADVVARAFEKTGSWVAPG